MTTCKANIEQKLQKELLVIKAHTIIDPGTMMVHPRNTTPTDRTMVRLRRLHRITLLAFFREGLLKKYNLLIRNSLYQLLFPILRNSGFEDLWHVFKSEEQLLQPCELRILFVFFDF